MIERVVELREDLKKFIAEDDMHFTDKVIDMMVDEFGERIDNYEARRNTTLGRETKTYRKLLAQAVRNVCERIKDVEFQEVRYDVIEDDYSEESNAEFNLIR